MPFLLTMLWERLRRNQVWILAVLAAAATLGGAAAFAWAEHLPLFLGFYWAITTATTVGYGDITPHNTAGRVVALAVMLTAIPLVGAVFASWAAILASTQVRRLLGMEYHAGLRNHLLVYGYSPTLAHFLQDLVQEKQRVVLVAPIDPGAAPAGVHFVAGDPTDERVLRRTRPELAGRAVVTGDSDGSVLMTAALLRHLAPGLPVMALTQSVRAQEALRDLGVAYTVSIDALMGQTIAKSLETPHAADLLLRLLESTSYRLREVPVEPEWVGQAFSRYRGGRAGLVLGLVHEGAVSLGVDTDPQIRPGDRVLLVTKEPG